MNTVGSEWKDSTPHKQASAHTSAPLQPFLRYVRISGTCLTTPLFALSKTLLDCVNLCLFAQMSGEKISDETSGVYDDGVSSISSEFWSRPRERFRDEMPVAAGNTETKSLPSELLLPALMCTVDNGSVKWHDSGRKGLPAVKCLDRILPQWMSEAPLVFKICFLFCIFMILAAVGLIAMSTWVNGSSEGHNHTTTDVGDDVPRNPADGAVTLSFTPTMQPTAYASELLWNDGGSGADGQDGDSPDRNVFDATANPSPRPVRGSSAPSASPIAITATPSVYAEVVLEEEEDEDFLPVATENTYTEKKDSKKKDDKKSDKKDGSKKKRKESKGRSNDDKSKKKASTKHSQKSTRIPTERALKLHGSVPMNAVYHTADGNHAE